MIPPQIQGGVYNMTQQATALVKVQEIARTMDANRIRQFNQLIAGTKQFKAGLLPVEAGSIPHIESKIKEWESERDNLKASLVFSTPYPLLSLEPFTWRDEVGYPALVPFALNSTEFTLTTNDNSQGFSISPSLPGPIVQCFKDVAERLKTIERTQRKQARLRTKFAGIIPPAVKAKISFARADFNDQIFLVAEAAKWTLDLIEPINIGDPLVVGWAEDRLWLIDAFDTTPVEQAMMEHLNISGLLS